MAKATDKKPKAAEPDHVSSAPPSASPPAAVGPVVPMVVVDGLGAASPAAASVAPKAPVKVLPKPAAAPLREAPADGIEKVLVSTVVGFDGAARGEAVGDGTGLRLPDADSSTIGPNATSLDVSPTLASDDAAVEHARASLAAASPDEKTKLADLGATVQPVTRRYKVWPHGELHRNGVVYKPGAELELTESVAAGIPCLVLAD